MLTDLKTGHNCGTNDALLKGMQVDTTFRIRVKNQLKFGSNNGKYTKFSISSFFIQYYKKYFCFLTLF